MNCLPSGEPFTHKNNLIQKMSIICAMDLQSKRKQLKFKISMIKTLRRLAIEGFFLNNNMELALRSTICL